MPQIEVYENRNLWMDPGKGASHSCYRGVANLLQLTAGRLHEENALRFIRAPGAVYGELKPRKISLLLAFALLEMRTVFTNEK